MPTRWEVAVQAFPVRLPSGHTYWTVLDDDLEVVTEADAYLHQLRFGQDAAETTTKAYAGALALYLGWCARTGQSWTSAERLGSFHESSRVLWCSWWSSAGAVCSGCSE